MSMVSADTPETYEMRYLKQHADLEQATKKADELTSFFSAPPIPVIEIAEQSGVNVVFADFGEHKEKVAGYCDFRSSRLYVNHEERRVRQNFTIAHELGHWLLHKDLFENDPDKHVVLPRFSKPDTNDPLELEANTFAANLLVPDRLLRPVASGFVQMKTLMRLFDVSRTMMEWRLWELRQ